MPRFDVYTLFRFCVFRFRKMCMNQRTFCVRIIVHVDQRSAQRGEEQKGQPAVGCDSLHRLILTKRWSEVNGQSHKVF
jgi:hypothetical protein